MIGNPKSLVEFLFNQDREKLFELKEYKDKRSLRANNYAWKLITEIANAQRLSKEEVYLAMLKDYGQSEIISVLSHIKLEGYLKYFEEIGKGNVQGKEFTHYRVYKGSSEFDTKEMSIFIDGIIEECRNLDIQTLPPAEVERLKEQWKA